MPISGEKIRLNPFQYWEYIPTEVKPFFVRTVAVIGADRVGKSTLVNKLSNTFNTTSAWEYKKEYLFTHLGNEIKALQFNDYDQIALGQAKYIDFAIKFANRVVFVDTDFVSLQAECKKDMGKEHVLIQAMIDKYRFDLILLIEDDKDDGNLTMRAKALIDSLEKNGISYVRIKGSDHDKRYLACVDKVNHLLGFKE